MLEGKFRPLYDKVLVEPLANHLAFLPNTITFFALLSGLLVFPILVFGLKWFAAILLLLSGYLDTLDGAIARKHNMSSEKGAVLDIIIDRVVEVVVVFALFAVEPSTRGWLCMGMLASILLCISSFLLVGIFSENQSDKSFHYSPGIIERTEAFIFFLLMILLPEWFTLLAIVFIILVVLTIFIRIFEFFRNF